MMDLKAESENRIGSGNENGLGNESHSRKRLQQAVGQSHTRLQALRMNPPATESNRLFPACGLKSTPRSKITAPSGR
jgi:hypothetical protein